MLTEWYRHPVMEPVRLFVERVLAFLPNIILMLVVLILGAVVARLLRAVLRRFLKVAGFDRFCERLGVTQMLAKGGSRYTPSEIAGRIVYYLTALVTFFMALAALNIGATNQLISDFFGYLPNLLVAFGILAAGYLLARFLYRSVLIAAVNAHVGHAGALARAAQVAVLILGCAVALEHLSIGRTVVLAAFSITFGGVILGLALAFGLAGKDMAKAFLEKSLSRPSDDEPKDEMRHI